MRRRSADRRTRRPHSFLLALTVVATVALPSSVTVAGPTGGALPPQLVEVIDVVGSGAVPADADLVAVNITALRAAGKGWFTAYSCDEDEPEASNVNYLADETVPNLALVSVATDGTICIATSQIADLIVDVVGYVPLGSDILPLATPYRVVDTRPDQTLAAGETGVIQVTGADGVFDPTEWPDPIDLVLANVTAISRGGTGYLSVTPCTPGTPATSSVNYGPGQTKANFVVSRLGDDGSLCVHSSEPADVIVDIAAVATDGITTLPEPVRIRDTRGGAMVRPGSALRLDISGRPDVPDAATAAVYNLTAAQATGVGYATSHPCLATPPLASNLNYGPGPATANGAITKLTAGGDLCVTTSTPTHLVVDLIGYTTGSADYVPITPRRARDTRRGWAPTCEKSVIAVAPQNDPGSLAVIDHRTGIRTPVPVASGDYRYYFDGLLDEDCRTFWVFQRRREQLAIVRIDTVTGTITEVLDRRPTHIFELADGTPAAWIPSPDGAPSVDPDVGVTVFGELVDLETMTSLLSFDEGPPGFNPMFDRNLRHMAFTVDGAFEVWDLDRDIRLLRDTRPGKYELSPDGVYVTRAYSIGERQFCEVLTTAGDVVQVFESGEREGSVIWECQWASDGVLFQLTRGYRTTFRHQLFGPSWIMVEPVRNPRYPPWSTLSDAWIGLIVLAYR